MSELETLLRQMDGSLRCLQETSLAKNPRNPRFADWRDLALVEEAKALLDELGWRAMEQPEAAKRFVAFAKLCNQQVWQLADAKPAHVAAVAERMMDFPCNWPALPKFQKPLLDQFKALGVGRKALFKAPPPGRKGFDPQTADNRAVLELVPQINRAKQDFERAIELEKTRAILCGKPAPTWTHPDPLAAEIVALKPLTKRTAKKWAAVVWELIMRKTNRQPEQHPELRPLGQRRAKHSEYEAHQPKATLTTAESNIRDGIKDRIYKAVRALAGRA